MPLLLCSLNILGLYNISTAAELKQISTNVANGNTYNGDTINLTTCIDLNGSSSNQFTPIGSESNQFQGTFNGNNHEISGLYIDRNATQTGLFGYIGSSGKVKDLEVSGYVRGGNQTGGIAGRSEGNIENCINNCTVTGYNLNEAVPDHSTYSQNYKRKFCIKT